ncbi:MAG: ATP synthase F1 subunit epsilon [Thermoleophilia bacterium]
MSTAVSSDRRTLAVQLLTPEGPVFDEPVWMVIATSVEGEIGILPRHAPFIAFLRTGETRLTLPDDSIIVYATTEGYMSVENDTVLVLVEQAEKAEDIDVPRAERALERAEAAIADAGEDDVVRVAAESARRRAENRLRVARRGES